MYGRVTVYLVGVHTIIRDWLTADYKIGASYRGIVRVGLWGMVSVVGMARIRLGFESMLC